jgi:DHA1 family tetracycline resistance protein-like MFS transporter
MAARRDVPRIVFLTVFIDLLGFGIVIPLLPLYAERYQPTPLAFGLLMSSYSAMQFVFAPLLGRLSDRFGRRPVLILSLIGTVAGYLVFAFARSLGALFFSRLLDGATGGNISTAQAVIADTTTREERAKGMGMVGMAFGLGFIFGPAIGGFAVKLGEAGPGLAAASVSFLALVWTALRLPETRPEGAPVRPLRIVSVRAVVRSLKRPLAGAVLLLAFVCTCAFATFESTFAQFLHGRFRADPSTVAWLFVVIGVTSAVVQGALVRRLVPRFGEARLVTAGTLALSCGFALLVFASSFPALVGTIVLISIGAGVLNPSLSGLLSKRTSPHEQGEALGSYQSMTAMGRIVGPIWGENTFLRFGAVGPYATGALLELLACVLAVARLEAHNGGVESS